MVVKRFADKDVNNASFFPTEGFGISRGVGVGGGGGSTGKVHNKECMKLQSWTNQMKN